MRLIVRDSRPSTAGSLFGFAEKGVGTGEDVDDGRGRDGVDVDGDTLPQYSDPME